MAPVILVAASGLAREVLAVLGRTGHAGDVLVVDDDPQTWGRSLSGAAIIGGLDLVGDHPDHEVVVCAGRGTSRRSIVARLADLGIGPDRFARVIDPSVHVPDDSRVGSGSVVLAHATLTANVHVGRHVVVMPNATLTHDDVLEDFVTVCAGASLGGEVHLRSGSYIGMNACVRERLDVGPDSVLGMGSVLLHELPAGQVWAGAPAGPLRPTARVVGGSP